MTDTPVVTIQCLVYNHEPYLRQCLDGFVMQKTNFPYEAIVHDDCSTDQSAAIIREYAEKYPDIIKPIYESENQYSKKDGRLVEIMNEHTRGRYVAFCEGDDYWTDPYKLQKQVEILEKDDSITMVYTGFNTVDFNSKPIIRPNHEYIKQHAPSGDIFGVLMERNYVMTLTMCIRREILHTDSYLQSPFKYDYTVACDAALHGKVIFLPAETGCYRKNPDSLMNTSGKEVGQHLLQVFRYYALLFVTTATGMPRSRYKRIQVIHHILKFIIQCDVPFLHTFLKKSHSTIPYFVFGYAKLTWLFRRVYNKIAP